MSTTLHRIRELCGVLASYAERLDHVRARAATKTHSASKAESSTESLWGGTVGAGPGARNGASRWYHAVEPHYRELDGLIRMAPRALYERVFSDSRVLAIEPELHRLRAAYEHDKELVQARAILEGRDGRARLARIVEQESYWALGPELRRVLSDSRDILVAGSGPLPLTALVIASALGVRVTCVERDTEAFALGRRLIEISGYHNAIGSIEADIVDLGQLDGYDAILGVVLLGVDTQDGQRNRKSEIVEHVMACMRPGATLILRDPHGLGRLLYPPVHLNASSDFEVVRWVPEVGSDQPYRSSLVVARRFGPEHRHAS